MVKAAVLVKALDVMTRVDASGLVKSLDVMTRVDDDSVVVGTSLHNV